MTPRARKYFRRELSCIRRRAAFWRRVFSMQSPKTIIPAGRHPARRPPASCIAGRSPECRRSAAAFPETRCVERVVVFFIPIGERIRLRVKAGRLAGIAVLARGVGVKRSASTIRKSSKANLPSAAWFRAFENRRKRDCQTAALRSHPQNRACRLQNRSCSRDRLR